MIIQRRILSSLLEALRECVIVSVAGPPRCGLSTLGGQVARAWGQGSLLLDRAAQLRSRMLEAPLEALAVAGSSPGHRRDRLVILDDARPEELSQLRIWLAGSAPSGPRFLLLGHGMPPAPHGSAGWMPEETRFELGPLSLAEVGGSALGRHWLRGGFPEAWNAASDHEALAGLRRWADSLAEERFAAAGLPWAPGRTRSLLAMLAGSSGGSLNENELARCLGVSRPTIVRSLEALEASGLVRFLPSLAGAPGRRYVKAPAFHVRDSGLLHALLGMESREELGGCPRLAASWEAYALEEIHRSLASSLREGAPSLGRLKPATGPALDLLFVRGGTPVAAAIFRPLRPSRPPRGLKELIASIGLATAWLILPDGEERKREDGLVETGLRRFLETSLGSL